MIGMLPSSTTVKPESTTIKNATIEFINVEQTGLRIEQCNTDLSKPYPANFSVDSPELKGVLEGFSSGDLVNLDYTNNVLNDTSIGGATTLGSGVKCAVV